MKSHQRGVKRRSASIIVGLHPATTTTFVLRLRNVESTATTQFGMSFVQISCKVACEIVIELNVAMKIFHEFTLAPAASMTEATRACRLPCHCACAAARALAAASRVALRLRMRNGAWRRGVEEGVEGVLLGS